MNSLPLAAIQCDEDISKNNEEGLSILTKRSHKTLTVLGFGVDVAELFEFIAPDF